MTKISTQERDRVERRYNELTDRRGTEVLDEIAKDFSLASDEVKKGIDRAQRAVKRTHDYNDECNAIERTLEEFAADGDARSIIIINSAAVKTFRENRAAWIEDINTHIENINSLICTTKTR